MYKSRLIADWYEQKELRNVQLIIIKRSLIYLKALFLIDDRT